MVAPLLQGKNREVPPKVKDLLWDAREKTVKPGRGSDPHAPLPLKSKEGGGGV